LASYVILDGSKSQTNKGAGGKLFICLFSACRSVFRLPRSLNFCDRWFPGFLWTVNYREATKGMRTSWGSAFIDSMYFEFKKISKHVIELRVLVK
jgi:hypothetical protein